METTVSNEVEIAELAEDNVALVDARMEALRTLQPGDILIRRPVDYSGMFLMVVDSAGENSIEFVVSTQIGFKNRVCAQNFNVTLSLDYLAETPIEIIRKVAQ